MALNNRVKLSPDNKILCEWFCSRSVGNFIQLKVSSKKILQSSYFKLKMLNIKIVEYGQCLCGTNY